MTAPIVRAASPRRKVRKPQAKTRVLHDAILAVAAGYERLSVRQLYYQLVSHYGLPKTEAAYNRVQEASVQLRRAGRLPYDKITDGSRVRRRQAGWDGIRDLLETYHEQYRRDYWAAQPHAVEIWCEKDALSGVIQPLCDEYGVTYVALRGFGSLSIAYESAQELRHAGKPARIYFFGDHDASGWALARAVEVELREHNRAIEFEGMALHPYQVEHYRLPTRPGKPTDSRHAAFVREFGDRCVELDALPPDVLEGLIRDVIEANIDWAEWGRMHRNEAAERRTLASLAAVPWQPGTTYTLRGD